jgi:hypothetical protein
MADLNIFINPEQIPNQRQLPEGGPAETIGAMIDAGGAENLKGLSLEVNNNTPGYSFVTPRSAPGSKQYVIRDVEQLQMEGTEPVRTVLPSSPKKFGDHIPFIYTQGGIFKFGRRVEDRPSSKQVTTYTIDKYNVAGELEDVLIYSQDELMDFLGKAKISVISREPEQDEPEPVSPGTKEVQVYLRMDEDEAFDEKTGAARVYDREGKTRENQASKHETIFDEITDQLEDQNVYDWGGMRWQVAERKNRKTGDIIPPCTVEVLRETLITERKGKDRRPMRAFVVRETDEHGNVTRKLLKDYEIKTYFEDRRGKISGLSAQRPKTGAELADSRTWPVPETRALYEEILHRDWNEALPEQKLDAIPNYEYAMLAMGGGRKGVQTWREEMEERTRGHLEEFIGGQMESFGTLSSDDRIAAWLLSYNDVANPAAEDTKAKLRDSIDAVKNSDEGKKRMKAVKELIGKYGIVRVYNLASKLKNDFYEAASTLRLPIDFSDTSETIETAGNSISWAIEGIADGYYFAKPEHAAETDETHEGLEFGDVLAGATEALQRQRDIVARRLASALVSETMHRKDITKPRIKDGEPVIKNGQPVYDTESVLLFEETPLEKIPRLTKEQAKLIEKKIYRDVENEQPVRLADLVKLGRVLQRGISSPAKRQSWLSN